VVRLRLPTRHAALAVVGGGLRPVAAHPSVPAFGLHLRTASCCHSKSSAERRVLPFKLFFLTSFPTAARFARKRFPLPAPGPPAASRIQAPPASAPPPPARLLSLRSPWPSPRRRARRQDPPTLFATDPYARRSARRRRRRGAYFPWSLSTYREFAVSPFVGSDFPLPTAPSIGSASAWGCSFVLV